MEYQPLSSDLGIVDKAVLWGNARRSWLIPLILVIMIAVIVGGAVSIGLSFRYDMGRRIAQIIGGVVLLGIGGGLLWYLNKI